MFSRKKKKPPERRLRLTAKGQWLMAALKNKMTYSQAEFAWSLIAPDVPFDSSGEIKKLFDELEKNPAADEGDQDFPPT